jgi:hypothetical protein
MEEQPICYTDILNRLIDMKNPPIEDIIECCKKGALIYGGDSYRRSVMFSALYNLCSPEIIKVLIQYGGIDLNKKELYNDYLDLDVLHIDVQVRRYWSIPNVLNDILNPSKQLGRLINQYCQKNRDHIEAELEDIRVNRMDYESYCKVCDDTNDDYSEYYDETRKEVKLVKEYCILFNISYDELIEQTEDLSDSDCE